MCQNAGEKDATGFFFFFFFLHFIPQHLMYICMCSSEGVKKRHAFITTVMFDMHDYHDTRQMLLSLCHGYGILVSSV